MVQDQMIISTIFKTLIHLIEESSQIHYVNLAKNELIFTISQNKTHPTQSCQ